MFLPAGWGRFKSGGRYYVREGKEGVNRLVVMVSSLPNLAIHTCQRFDATWARAMCACLDRLDPALGAAAGVRSDCRLIGLESM